MHEASHHFGYRVERRSADTQRNRCSAQTPYLCQVFPFLMVKLVIVEATYLSVMVFENYCCSCCTVLSYLGCR